MTTATKRQREFHAAHARQASTLSGAQQMLMPYRHAKLASVAPGFEFKPGFIYAQVRAISARINQNFDGWPSSELKKSYRTFIGKPCFVNHQNFDPKRARGKVVAARYVEAGDDKYIETVMEIDAHRFPKLAKEIREGGLDSVSMGVEAGFTICSFCGNKAVDTPDFCEHVKYHKGRKLRTASGEERLVYEKCYKLGFFELSWVFDPADETAVTSRVIAASNLSSMESRINRLAYGEIEAPEDVDTLRNEDEDDTDDFKHYVESPKELQGPDLDQTKQLDRAQEDQGLDADRRSEDVEDIGGAPMPARNARRQRRAAPFADPRDAIDEDREFTPEEHRAMGDKHFDAPMLIDPRTGRRYYAADFPPPDPSADPTGGDPTADPSADPSMGGDPSDPTGGGAPPDDPTLGGDPSGGGGQTDEELIAEAQQDLQSYEDSQDGGDDFSSDEGGTDDDYADQDADEDSDGFDDDGDGADDDMSDDDSDGLDDDTVDDDGDSGDLPPWLQDGSSPDETDPAVHAARRKGNSRSSTQKKRRATRGAPMSLAQRQRVASGQWPRRHYADDSGHFDGGPYGEDNQGEQEDVFLSQTPGTEAVAAPTPGDGTISNTENNLVARKLQQRIQAQAAQVRRDLIAYEQITGRRVQADDYDPTGGNMAVPTPHPAFPDQDLGGLGEAGRHNPGPHTARRRYADDGEWPSPGEQSVSGTEKADTVDPALSGTDQQGLKGDFDNIALDSAETQPKDASRHYFALFDRWLQSTTGKTAAQHGNAVFLRRTAARFCQANGIPVEAMFPTLGNALREARKNESTTRRRSNMRKRADEKLDVAAPQDRIDVEAPVSDTTDADAQASQFDLGDFGSNAGDNLADPDLSPDSQIWAPGEGDSSKTSSRKADGITAVRYAEAYIRAGLAPNTPEEKWKVAGLAMTMRQGTILDRISMLDAVNAQRAAAARRTAGVNRGAGRGVPPGLGQRQLTAGQAHNAANDLSGDVAIWLK